MSDLVKCNPGAEMTHEGVLFLVDEMVRDHVKAGWEVPKPVL